MAVIDISTLTETANRIDRELKHLPYIELRETLGVHGINLMQNVQNKDTITNIFRKGGIAKPYVPALVEDNDLAETQERILQVEKAYANVIDEPSRFKKTIVGPDVLLGKNQSKRHPWEVECLTSIVKTFGEDICDALFPAKRDILDRSPMGLFHGYDTIIDFDIAAGLISAAKGNIKETDVIKKPVSDTDYNAYDRLLAFWRQAHPLLRNAKTLLLIPFDLGDAYDDAYFNKYKTKPTMDNYNRTVLDGSGGKCTIVRSLAMGTGQRIILTVPGNFDFGMDTFSDGQFVTIRNIEKDPNFVQFWIQADYGCRIRNVHPKVFQINEGTPVPNALSGDYQVTPIEPEPEP